MLKIIKKTFIIILLLTISITIYLIKIIHEFFVKNKSKMKKYAKSFKLVLQEELER